MASSPGHNNTLVALFALASLRSRRDESAEVPADPAECSVAELLLAGECVPVGVLVDGCGRGFLSDGRGGGEAVLPVGPCPGGMMAVPGESACREVRSACS